MGYNANQIYKSFVYNQLVEKNSAPTASGLSLSYEGKNVFIINGNATQSYPSITQPISFKLDDKYFISSKILGGTFSGSSIALNVFVSFGKTIPIGTSAIEKCTNNYRQSIQLALGNDLGVFTNYKLFIQCINITDIETALGITINTIEDFYDTEVGKAVKNGVYLPYSPNNTNYYLTRQYSPMNGNNEREAN